MTRLFLFFFWRVPIAINNSIQTQLKVSSVRRPFKKQNKNIFILFFKVSVRKLLSQLSGLEEITAISARIACGEWQTMKWRYEITSE